MPHPTPHQAIYQAMQAQGIPSATDLARQIGRAQNSLSRALNTPLVQPGGVLEAALDRLGLTVAIVPVVPAAVGPGRHCPAALD